MLVRELFDADGRFLVVLYLGMGLGGGLQAFTSRCGSDVVVWRV